MSEPNSISNESKHADDARSRIIVGASELIAAGGRDAATTRAVAAAAGVQAPTIYRLFGDKRGLLDAVAEHGLASYMKEKSGRKPHADPVQDLRDGWDMHISFGLANPGLFAIIAGDPHPRASSMTMSAGEGVLHRRIRNIALAGRLRVSEDRAVALLQSGGMGAVLVLLSQPEEIRDMGLADAAREAIVEAITGEASPILTDGPNGAAAALRASLDQTSVLTDGEKRLLEELLDRIANGA